MFRINTKKVTTRMNGSLIFLICVLYVTSIFTCPYSGVYFFTISFYSNTEDMFAHIMHRGESIARAMADNDCYDDITHASAFFVVECI